MTVDFLIPESSAIKVESIEIKAEHLFINVTSTLEKATCPYCGEESESVHSWYKRKPADVPSGAFVTRWQMRVRCFFCENPHCQHHTFAERFPGVVAPYARRTDRLANQQCQVAFEVGGEAGARLLHLLCMPVSADTLIRMVRRTAEMLVSTPRVLGVDDWAKRKGLSYGTILVDLEKHRVVDLLDERSAESFSEWLEQHPGVEIISRDRGTEYKKGATDGAPDAMQVADRWHLLKNLKEALERLITEKPACLKAAADLNSAATTDSDDPKKVEASTVETGLDADVLVGDEPKSISQSERQKEIGRKRKQERFALVKSLHKEGLSLRKISQEMGMSYKTIRKYLDADTCPFYPEHVSRGPTKLDPFQDALASSWQAGCHSATKLWRKLREQGFDGSRGLVQLWVAKQRKLMPKNDSSRTEVLQLHIPRPRLIPWRPSRVTWLLFKAEAELEPEEQLSVARIKDADPSVAQAHDFVQRFCQMVRDKQPKLLSSWLQDVKDSSITALVSFANGLQQDLDAVTNALSLEWSNGQTEGQVHRLKFIKRQMYGRANFDLLRRRVLGYPNLRC